MNSVRRAGRSDSSITPGFVAASRACKGLEIRGKVDWKLGGSGF